MLAGGILVGLAASKFFYKESLRDAMNTIYKAGINGKIYRLWYKLNQKTKIGVQTAFGTSQYKECGETVATWDESPPQGCRWARDAAIF